MLISVLSFSTDQQVYDDSYMIVPLSLARSLFNYDKEVTAVELKVKDSGDIAPVKKEIQRILGDQYIVQDRFEQQEASFQDDASREMDDLLDPYFYIGDRLIQRGGFFIHVDDRETGGCEHTA